MEIIKFFKTHQQTVALAVGYLLVAALAFGLGRITSLERTAPEITVEESFTPLLNNTENIAGTQSTAVPAVAGESTGGCDGKIKGNISSKGDRIYHMPGGSFYARTNPEQCFDTEQEAREAGFRKSSR